MSILDLILKRNKQQPQEQDQGYYNSGFWNNYGRTDPSLWANPQDTGYGSWGSLLGTAETPQTSQNGFSFLGGGSSPQSAGSSSLLDLLARVTGRNLWGW